MKTLHEKGIHQPGVLDLRPLMELVRVLREPGGCPWDRVQTHQSMRRELVEEVYEMLEAIDDGNVAGMREEMGDVLLQVVFHARLAEEKGLFAMQDVIDDVVKKLVHRHPHVFGSTRVSGAGEVMANWETLKAQEKTERTHALDGIAKGLPALMRAYKLSARAAKPVLNGRMPLPHGRRYRKRKKSSRRPWKPVTGTGPRRNWGTCSLPWPSTPGNWTWSRKPP